MTNFKCLAFFIASAWASGGCGPNNKQPVYVESAASGAKDSGSERNSLDRDVAISNPEIEFFALDDKRRLGLEISYDPGSKFEAGWRMVGGNVDEYNVGFVAGSAEISGGTNLVSIRAGEISSVQLGGKRHKLYMVARNESLCYESQKRNSAGEGRRSSRTEGGNREEPRVRCKFPTGAEVVDGIHPAFDVLAIVTLVPL